MKRTEVGTINRPEPAAFEDIIQFIKKEMSHVDIVAKVMLSRSFAVMADLTKVQAAIHPSVSPKGFAYPQGTAQSILMKSISPVGSAQGNSLSLDKGVVHILGRFSSWVVGRVFKSVVPMLEGDQAMSPCWFKDTQKGSLVGRLCKIFIS